MKICFYSPYFPNHFGGGEKHLLDVAMAAAKKHQVTISISQIHSKNEMDELEKIRQNYEEFYGASLSKLEFIFAPIGSAASFWEKLLWTKNFDGLYYVTDGSLFFSLAAHNYLHIQIPFRSVLSSLDQIKLLQWGSINTNSSFTKNWIEKQWGITVDMVLHPMVQIDDFTDSPKKEKIILNVGRFFKQLHSKRQDILVTIFKKLCDEYSSEVKGWKLLLVGNIEDKSYFDEVKKSAHNYPVEFITNANRGELIKLYEKASLYWHATGFGIDETKDPERVEHFGITTVEAMAAHVVPLVVGKGGQKEVLGKLFTQLAWETEVECVEKTVNLIQNKNEFTRLQTEAQTQSKEFAKDVFEKKVTSLFTV